jgi:oxygen-independent coproporphyrinogen-3 oxidase
VAVRVLMGAYRALYIHIPFCKQRCGYCDFTTEARAQDDPALDAYLDELLRAVRSASRNGELGSAESIYIGGGTPTHLGHKRLVNLVYTLSLSLNLHDDTEFTVEANPESLTAPLVRDLFALGVNRFSIGVQSFDDRELAALGRVHDAQQARAAVEIVRERCENISLDLMCGIPLQTPGSWEQSLATALATGVNHVSVYPLSIEEGTPLVGFAVDEDIQATMMEDAAAMLGAAGLERYEVASYARPGFACRHNTAYWTGLAYLGLGKGAHGMRMTAEGRERLVDGAVQELLTFPEAAAEDLMLGMRRAQGVSLEQVAAASTLLPNMQQAFEQALDRGLVRVSNGRYQPTDLGWLNGNELYSTIWDARS